MKALVVSDVVTPLIYSPQIRQRFSHVGLVISCGDLPYYYQEYIISLLDVPLYFVRGNHDKEIEFGSGANRSAPGGGIDLHRRVINDRGLLIAGVEGSLRYRDGPFQYSQSQMWRHILALTPKLVRNRLIYGRYLDIFVTHAPPLGIHDQDDLTHRGIEAFRWFIQVFRPAIHLHGHIHVIMPNTITVTQVGTTWVINGYGFREIDLDELIKRK
jgi:Icc-related predicted phosphoesterase